jgi:hypothetical protein
MYSCEGHIVGDNGLSHGQVIDINLVCPNHRFETLPEGFAYPKGAKHRDIHRTILYKYVKGKLLARIDGKYIPYDLESDRKNHLRILKSWADSLPAIDIKKHPECYSEYLVTGKPKQSYLEYELPKCRTFTVRIKPAEYDSTIHHIVGYCGKVLEVQEIGEVLELHYWAKTDLFE